MQNHIHYAPLYRQVAKAIRAKLGRRYHVGDSLPTESEFAKEFGVSLITVRGALKELRAEGFISSASGRSTRVERVSRVGPTALLIELDYEHPGMPAFYSHLVQSLVSELNDRGIEHQVYKGKLKPGDRPDRLTSTEFARDMNQGRISGVITVSNPALPWYAKALHAGIPVLGTDEGYRDAVLFNTYGSIDMGVARLVECGSRRIAAVGWEGVREHSLRDYFYQVLQAYGISGNDHWFKTDLYPLLAGSGWEAFREIWTSSAPKPDGVFVLDSEMLPGVCQAMNELGLKSPRDFHLLAKVTAVPEFRPIDGVYYLTAYPEQLAREIVTAYSGLVMGTYSGHSFVPYHPLELAKPPLAGDHSRVVRAVAHRAKT